MVYPIAENDFSRLTRLLDILKDDPKEAPNVLYERFSATLDDNMHFVGYEYTPDELCVLDLSSNEIRSRLSEAERASLESRNERVHKVVANSLPGTAAPLISGKKRKAISFAKDKCGVEKLQEFLDRAETTPEKKFCKVGKPAASPLEKTVEVYAIQNYSIGDIVSAESIGEHSMEPEYLRGLIGYSYNYPNVEEERITYEGKEWSVFVALTGIVDQEPLRQSGGPERAQPDPTAHSVSIKGAFREAKVKYIYQNIVPDNFEPGLIDNQDKRNILDCVENVNTYATDKYAECIDIRNVEFVVDGEIKIRKGVFARKKIERGQVVGVYFGKLTETENITSKYSFNFYGIVLDAKESGNYTRFIHRTTVENINLYCYPTRIDGIPHIYLIAIRDIPIETELQFLDF